MKTIKGNFTKKTKIMLSDYWDQIDGLRNHSEIEKNLNQNPNYLECFGVRPFPLGTISSISRIVSKMEISPSKNLYQLCKIRSWRNELMWETLLFLYENDRVRVRKDKILKLKSKLELKML